MSATLELVRLKPIKIATWEGLLDAIRESGERGLAGHPGPTIAELIWNGDIITGSVYHENDIEPGITVAYNCFIPRGYNDLVRLMLQFAESGRPFVIRYELQNRDSRNLPASEYRQVIWEKCKPWK